MRSAVRRPIPGSFANSSINRSTGSGWAMPVDGLWLDA